MLTIIFRLLLAEVNRELLDSRFKKSDLRKHGA